MREREIDRSENFFSLSLSRLHVFYPMMFIEYPRPIHSLLSLSFAFRTYIVVDRFSRYVHFISFIHHHSYSFNPLQIFISNA